MDSPATARTTSTFVLADNDPVEPPKLMTSPSATDSPAVPTFEVDADFLARASALRLWLWDATRANAPRPAPVGPGGPEAQAVSVAVGEALDAIAPERFSDKPTELSPGLFAIRLRGATAPRSDDRKLLAVAITGAFPAVASVPQDVRGRVCKSDATHACESLAAIAWAFADLARHTDDANTIGQFSEQLSQAFEETNLLFRIGRLFSQVADPQETMRTVAAQVQAAQPFAWVAIAFADAANVLRPLRNQLIVNGTPPCDNEALASAATGLLAKHVRAGGGTRILTAAGGDDLARLSGGEVLAEFVVQSGTRIGVMLAGGKAGPDPAVSSFETQFFGAAAGFLGLFHENLLRMAQQKDVFLGTVAALSASIDAKDPYTRGHSERVGLLAAMVAGAMGLPSNTAEEFRLAGLLHDVGKIGVPEGVLLKPGRLTEEEFDQIKRHPAVGHAILKGIPGIESLLPGVLYHHEKWNGQGYPHGLAGEAIPPVARVLAVCDTFDAMSSNRAYRARMPREQVLAEIANQAGKQFAPEVVTAFLALDLSPFDESLAVYESAVVRPAA